MRLLVLFCVVASAAAAPFHRYDDDFGALGDFLSDDHMFDTNRFWAQLEANMMEQLLNDLYKHFPSDVTSVGIHGDEYRLVVPLPGYESKDIIVKAQPGALMIQAVKRVGHHTSSYLNARTLPANVDVDGRWGYENGVLTIAFPLKKKTAPTTESATDSTTESATESFKPNTSAPASHESVETEKTEVGLDKRVGEGASETEDMMRTNEISNNDLEDTTYAVDLKGDVEFVPVQVK